MPLRFRKSQRLVKEEDFRRVISCKRFVCKGILRVYGAPNHVDAPRLGVSVSKSCGNAVVRNRLKRFGREAFRIHQHEIPPGFDYILIFSGKAAKMGARTGGASKKTVALPQYKDVENSFLTMVRLLEDKWTGQESR